MTLYIVKRVYFLLFFVTLLFSSCEEEEKTTRTVQGYIYKNCDKEPLVGVSFSAIVDYTRNTIRPHSLHIGDFTTDENGFYRLTYTSNKKFQDIWISDKEYANYPIIEEKYEDHLDMVHYVDGQSTHNVRILSDPNHSFTNMDTLFIAEINSVHKPLLIVPGPFTGNQDFKLKYHEIVVEYAPHVNLKRSGSIFQRLFVWGMGREELMKMAEILPYYIKEQEIQIDVPVCGVGEEIVVDLRNKQSN